MEDAAAPAELVLGRQLDAVGGAGRQAADDVAGGRHADQRRTEEPVVGALLHVLEVVGHHGQVAAVERPANVDAVAADAERLHDRHLGRRLNQLQGEENQVHSIIRVKSSEQTV